AREFACALCASDAVYLTGIYAAREQPIPGITSDLIASAFGPEKHRLAWQGERAEVLDALVQGLKPGDVLITMGAGDITRTSVELLHRISAT
ncbi:MAG TPA: UDP-N-acetylmuramate--L-alanine ligase, partial [Gemmatimonadaceae bacterium]|nr:UDP-N-acetylmuramate--L-alanine ligase [Gemmatimonadaceae bacterium]